MYKGYKTIWEEQIYSYNRVGKTLTPLANTSISEKFGVTTDQINDQPHSARYWTIGISDGHDTLGNFRHRAIDGALFNHIPFAMRPVGTEFGSVAESYRLKKLVTISGTTYVAYYGKVINSITHDTKLSMIKLDNITEKLSSFDNERNDILNPVPITNNDNDILMNGNTYVAIDAKMHLHLNAEEISELKNVYDILGIENNITEIGLYSAVDKTINGSTDSYYGLMTHFLDISINVEELDVGKGFNKTIELGALEPLYYE